MISLVVRFLLLRLGRNAVFAVLSLTALLTVFATLAEANQVAAKADRPVLPLVFYAMLRAPALLDLILPFGVLLAALFTFGGLADRREMVALQSAGFSLYRATGICGVAVALLVCGQMVFAETLGIDAARMLNRWEANGYRGLPALKTARATPEWLASGGAIVSMDGVAANGAVLERPTAILRNERGVMERYLKGERARFSEGSWELTNAFSKNLETGEVRREAVLPLPIEMEPAQFVSFNRPVETLRMPALARLAWSDVETQRHTRDHYRLWFHRRLARPLSALAMVVVAAPAALRSNRSGRRRWMEAGVMATGFLYFVVEQVALAMGEGGEIPAAVAAWGPPSLFGLLAAWWLVREQG